ncbi:organomercurial lyase [Sulfurirhabdus autotrophica]|uniref:Alkylmercury lyase-like protein n=1 Tax=Sulfurirhabdus autotrophica TaxID=1706046 RepID=A0A4R3YB95_9PROT|nr:organomercurial lyase [Sulfurirhabdus autotrophica]TCV89042.1 alkylmercury lyase-like protein [Sulfurirhabdus autotrophica]
MTTKPQATADTQRVLAALTGIQRAYPLERRIKNEACDDTRETYLAVLLRWLQTGTAPLTEGFDRDSLDELTALDAIFIVNDQIGCPPFNVVKTDIQVHFPHETLHVLSALDALALPRMLNTAATVETLCAMSGQPIHFSLTQEGKIRMDESNVAVVAFQKVANSITRYTFDLAPGIRFVLPEHAGTLQQTLTLDEATVVANTFYSFQRKLLQDVAV